MESEEDFGSAELATRTSSPTRPAIDSTIDQYNGFIRDAVAEARYDGLDWAARRHRHLDALSMPTSNAPLLNPTTAQRYEPLWPDRRT